MLHRLVSLLINSFQNELSKRIGPKLIAAMTEIEGVIQSILNKCENMLNGTAEGHLNGMIGECLDDPPTIPTPNLGELTCLTDSPVPTREPRHMMPAHSSKEQKYSSLRPETEQTKAIGLSVTTSYSTTTVA